MTLQKPPKLQTGSHVRIVSPSGPVTARLVEPAIEQLRAWGLEVSLDDHWLARKRYLAGHDGNRAEALRRALSEPGIDMVLASRGGYGAMRILDAIDWAAFAAKPRILCGFSDITALHFAANKVGVATLHGHVAKSFTSQAADIETLRTTLFGTRGPQVSKITPVRGGQARGPMLGGNLSLVAALAGTRYLPSMEGAILFVEDVTEEDYRIDRLLTSLRLNPAFENLAGLVLGGFDQCSGTYVSEPELPEYLAQLAREFGDTLGIPVAMNFPAGHGSRNVPIPLGVVATLNSNNGTLTFDEEFVR